MYLSYTEDQLRLQRELREYFARLITPEVEAQLEAEGFHNGPVSKKIRRRMGQD